MSENPGAACGYEVDPPEPCDCWCHMDSAEPSRGIIPPSRKCERCEHVQSDAPPEVGSAASVTSLPEIEGDGGFILLMVASGFGWLLILALAGYAVWTVIS